MPHAIFDTQNITSPTDGGDRQLIPGIEPGGSRAGQPTKPALLIKNLFGELSRFQLADQALEVQRSTLYLKLSQETGLDPGLILPVASAFGTSRNEASADASSIFVEQMGHLFAGTVWVPRVVGFRCDEGSGAPTTVRWNLHLDYERVDVPWMDWFIMWDFLDNVVDDQEEF